MLNDLPTLSATIGTLPADQPMVYADAYWQVYNRLVVAKTPTLQARLLKLLHMGATMDAAALIFQAAFGETGLSYQVHGTAGNLPAIACCMDTRYRQVTGPHPANCPGHALLKACIGAELYLQQKDVRHVG